jgi:hypothetical protein
MKLDGEDDGFIDFGKAGLDTKFTLFKIYSRPVKDALGHDGQHSMDCQFPLAKFEQHNDPVGVLKYLCRKYLLHCRQSTGIPFEMWIIEFSPIMERYQIPSHLFFDTARDRNWIL